MVGSQASVTPFFSALRRNSSCSTTSASRPNSTTPASVDPRTADQLRYRIRRRQFGHRIWHQGRLLPVPPQFGRTCARNVGGHGQDGRQGRSITTRSLPPSTSRHEVRHHIDGRPDADHTTASTRVPISTARPPPSCRSRSMATTARACNATSRLERRQAGIRRKRYSTCRRCAVPHRRRHQARSDQRLLARPPIPTSAWCRAMSAGAARLPARNRRLLPQPLRPRQSVSRCLRSDVNPYSGFAAMLMAGLAMASRSSIRARRWTRTRQAKEELKEIPTVCGSSREALENHIRTPRLPASAAYSTTTSSTALSKPEDDRGELPEMTPHPVEFDMYYSL